MGIPLMSWYVYAAMGRCAMAFEKNKCPLKLSRAISVADKKGAMPCWTLCKISMMLVCSGNGMADDGAGSNTCGAAGSIRCAGCSQDEAAEPLGCVGVGNGALGEFSPGGG